MAKPSTHMIPLTAVERADVLAYLDQWKLPDEGAGAVINAAPAGDDGLHYVVLTEKQRAALDGLFINSSSREFELWSPFGKHMLDVDRIKETIIAADPGHRLIKPGREWVADQSRDPVWRGRGVEHVNHAYYAIEDVLRRGFYSWPENPGRVQRARAVRAKAVFEICAAAGLGRIRTEGRRTFIDWHDELWIPPRGRRVLPATLEPAEDDTIWRMQS